LILYAVFCYDNTKQHQTTPKRRLQLAVENYQQKLNRQSRKTASGGHSRNTPG
jgi:hypothetical protein